MVGTVIAIIRGVAEGDVIQKALSSDQIDLPMAPGLGLVLEQVRHQLLIVSFRNKFSLFFLIL